MQTLFELIGRHRAILHLVERDQLPRTALLLVLLAGTMTVLRPAAGTPVALLAVFTGLMGVQFAGTLAIAAVVFLVALLFRLRGVQSAERPSPGAVLGEASLLLGGLLLYVSGRILVTGSWERAHANAERLLAVERTLGLSFERQLQGLVLPHDRLVQGFNSLYSFLYLAVVIAAMLWLYLADRPNYRLMRNSLGVSALLALALIAALPVAPPRLMLESGLVDTVVVVDGREHGFANEFAAIPSLHVGWMALAGYALARGMRGWAAVVTALLPVAVMGVTVIVTGNHYVLDGVIGCAVALLPALALARWRHRRGAEPAPRVPGLAARVGARAGAVVRQVWMVLRTTAKARFSAVALGMLLTYLLVGELISPGFTDYWGYLVFQIAATLCLLVAGEVVFREQGGLAWTTHILAVAVGYADTLGTDGNMYASFAEYDKITHFLGVAAVTAAVYDCLRALDLRGKRSRSATAQLQTAMLVGIAAGVGWEIYEWVGDNVFHTSRIGGLHDTTNDLISNTLGALTAGLLLWREDVRGELRRVSVAVWRSRPFRRRE
jgi:uncharacterized membrane protein YjdF